MRFEEPAGEYLNLTRIQEKIKAVFYISCLWIDKQRYMFNIWKGDPGVFTWNLV